MKLTVTYYGLIYFFLEDPTRDSADGLVLNTLQYLTRQQVACCQVTTLVGAHWFTIELEPSP